MTTSVTAKTYTDSYGMYHDKPTDGKSPSSNNPNIYTAYVEALGLPVNKILAQQHFNDSLVGSQDYFKVNRRPNKQLPPLSHDEIMGMAAMKIIPIHEVSKLKDSYWQYNNKHNYIPKKWSSLNWIKVIKQFWKLKDKHRNTVWEEKGYEEAEVIAFTLKPDVRYFVKKMYNLPTSLWEEVMFYISTMSTLLGNNNSTINMRWLMLTKLKMNDTILYKLGERKFKQSFQNYFPKDHPIYKAWE